MDLTQALHRACQQHPDKTALVCEGRRVSYRQWADRSARLAAVLRAQGVAPGDRVALWSAGSEHYGVAYTALWWMGAVACPVNTRWSAAEIAFSLRDCGVSCLLADGTGLALAAPLRAELPLLREVLAIDAAVTASPLPDGRFGGDHLAALLYTGGTTGRAKGVMLSHGSLVSAALARIASTPLQEDGVALVTMPLFHTAALSRLLQNLVVGATTIVMPQFRTETALDAIEAEGVTDLPLAPSMLQTLIDDPRFDARRLRSVRRIGYGAAPSAEALLERAQQLLPGVGFMQSYGMTENAAVATISQPADHDEAARRSGRSRSAGRACRIAELRIVDADGQDLPTGAVGEIVMRGPNVMLGYWNRPEETSQALRDGWLYTGDAGRLDADGYLYVVDRLKDMIVTGGENVYSAEVENLLQQHPAVAACAVFGVPSAQWGEAVHAAVVLRPGTAADEATLREHCRAQLAGYKCPKQIEFLSALPLTAVGKVAKSLLREPHWRGHERGVA